MTMHRSRLSGLATASLALLLSTGAADLAAADLTLPPGAEQAAQAIHAGSLAAPIRFLASDALEGRGPASRGDQLARGYLASELESLGLVPGGPNGSWQQSFDIVGIDAAMPAVWTFSIGEKAVGAMQPRPKRMDIGAARMDRRSRRSKQALARGRSSERQAR
jgi:hypothetical protein